MKENNAKQILLKDLNLVKKKPGTNQYKKMLKNINLSIKQGVLSIIGAPTYERHILGHVLQRKLNPTQGTAEYLGDYFEDKRDFRGDKIEFITYKRVENIYEDIDINQFLRESIMNKKLSLKNYGPSYHSALLLKKELISQKNELENEKIVETSIINDRIDAAISAAYSQDKKIQKEEKNLAIIRGLSEKIERNNFIIKNRFKLIDEESIILKKVHKGKEINMKESHKLLVKDLKEIKKKEIKELKDIRKKDEIPRDIEQLIYSRSVREIKKLYSYIKGLDFGYISINKKIYREFDKLLSLNTRKTFYISLEVLLNEITETSNFTNAEVSKQLRDRVSFIRNILDPQAPINCKQFNDLLNLIYKRYNDKIEYFEKVISDIQQQIEKIDLLDKQEKINSMRELWEYKKVSLRFQQQIYRERVTVVKHHSDIIESSSLSHTLENNNEIYDLIIDFENLLTKIDVATNRWRFKREINKIKLKSKIKTNLLKEENIELANKIQSIKDSLDLGNEYDSYKKKIALEIKQKLSDKGILDKPITREEKKKYASKISELENKIEELDYKISFLKERTDVKDFDNQELLLADLMDDISFSSDSLDLKLSSTSIAQRQRLSLIKAVLEGKEVVIIENPLYDLDINAKSEIAASIKEISSKYNIMIILLTEDIKLSNIVATRVAFFDNGTIFEKGSLKTVMCNPIHPLTKHMISESNNIKLTTTKYKGELLNHNIFTPLDNIEVEKDHIVYCTEEELIKWT